MSFPRLDGIEASKAQQDEMTAPGDSGRACRCPGQFPGGERLHVAIARAWPAVAGFCSPANRQAPSIGQRRSGDAGDPRRCTRGAAAVAAIHGAELARRADRVVSIRDGRVTGQHLQQRTRSHG